MENNNPGALHIFCLLYAHPFPLVHSLGRSVCLVCRPDRRFFNHDTHAGQYRTPPPGFLCGYRLH